LNADFEIFEFFLENRLGKFSGAVGHYFGVIPGISIAGVSFEGLSPQ
jgi:hypothetical protein